VPIFSLSESQNRMSLFHSKAHLDTQTRDQTHSSSQEIDRYNCGSTIRWKRSILVYCLLDSVKFKMW